MDELNHQARKHWVQGKWVAIDEQTIGFKGRSGMKLRISYKREGDGFQCDAICDEGYTFSFFFRHGDAPKLDKKYDRMDLSDTAKRVIWLAEGCRMFGLAFIWTICLTHKSCFLPFTLRSV